MRDLAELDRLWKAATDPPKEVGTVRLVVVRVDDGVHETPERVELTVDGGVVGDRWSRKPERLREAQVAITNVTAAEIVVADKPLHLPGDNLFVDLDISEGALPLGTRLRAGTALLEVTAKAHLGCRKFSARFGADALRWVNVAANRTARLRGVYGAVVEAGTVAVGDRIEVVTDSA